MEMIYKVQHLTKVYKNGKPRTNHGISFYGYNNNSHDRKE